MFPRLLIVAFALRVVACGSEESLEPDDAAATTLTGDDEAIPVPPSSGIGASLEPVATSPSECAVSGFELGVLPEPLVSAHRVPLRVHRGGSALADDAICGVMQEVNLIFWAQAGICFEIQIVRHEVVSEVGLDLWFLERIVLADGLEPNGLFIDDHHIYSIDLPMLEASDSPTRHPAARTAAHELGHALGLAHQDCGSRCNDLLMRSGFRGFRLAQGEPADVDEIARARASVTSVEREGGALAATLPSGQSCGRPVLSY